MVVKLIDGFTIKLDGDIVRITTTSGGNNRESAVPIAVFIRSNLEGREVIAKWQARQADVTRINKAKRKG
jgi:hypothetical protein